MRPIVCLTIAAVWLAAMAGTAGAQSVAGDVPRGRDLAERLCTNCHNVKAEQTGPMRADVPGFPSIANRPGVSAEILAGRIIIPHPAMPGVQLTVRELRDIVAYILSLKREK